MAGPKFFVYGGCRWREIDTTSGRVDGWGNVQFLTVRSGRLQVARKSSVLRGLRSLAASEPTSVRDGPQVSQLRHEKIIEKRKERDDLKYQHHHCCCNHQNLQYISDANFNNLLKPSTNTAAVQCTLEKVNIDSDTAKSVHNHVGETKASETKNNFTFTIFNNKKQVQQLATKRKRPTSDDETRELSPIKNVKTANSKNIANGKIDVELNTSLGERKRTQESKEAPAYNIDKYDKNRLRKSSQKPTEDKNREVLSQKKVSKSSNSRNFEKSTKSGTLLNRSRSKRKLSSSEDENSNEVVVKRKLNKITKSKTLENDLELSKKLLERKHTQEPLNEEPYKELVISEEDVLLLRTFIERDDANIFNVDLEQFDTDDVYKGMIFYRLNPLVNVARCQRIANMLREQRSQSNTVSLEDFISTLGLRSVQDTVSQASSKYKMRTRRNKYEKSSYHTTSESELNKENKNSKLNNLKTKKNNVLVENNKKNKIRKNALGLVGKMSSRPRKLEQVELVEIEISSDDSVFQKSREKKVDQVKRPKPDAINHGSGVRVSGKGGKAGGREYSAAEDAAIVSWLREAGRARRVNGNQIWQELQPVHHQRTGQFRSWHSLRNRYLRYVLPALGSLALAPHEAARLRADAAAGKLKSRKKPQRPNSLVAAPRVKSAWARRPRSPPRESSPSPARLSPSPARLSLSSRSSRSPSPAPASPSTSSSQTDQSSDSRFSKESRYSDPKFRRTILKHKSAKKSGIEEKKTRTLRSSTFTHTPTHKHDTRMPTYSELTRRFASTHRSTPSGTPTLADKTDKRRSTRLSDTTDRLLADTDRPRTRRLYNPNAI